MTTNYDDLYAKAQAATPGPWKAVERLDRGGHEYADVFAEDANKIVVFYGKYTIPVDAAYIAAASPDVVCALIDENRRYREALDNFADNAEEWWVRDEAKKVLHDH